MEFFFKVLKFYSSLIYKVLGNKAQDPFIGEHQPKVSRMLDLFMDWLVKSALVRPSRYSSIYGIFYQLIL